MKATKTKLMALLLVLVMAIGLFAACAPEEQHDSPPPQVEEDPHVTELIITSPPEKTDYKAGQLFDASGMRLSAKWSHGVDEELSPGECEQSPTGPLTSDVTKITFTYEGVSCSQTITVKDVNVVGVTFDFSTIGAIQLLGMLDLTAITVKAKYADDTEEEIFSEQYEMYEGDEKIADPMYYNVTEGTHTITVKYGEWSDSFTFTALYGYNVPLDVYTPEQAALQIEAKNSFLEKPENGGGYGFFKGVVSNYLGEVGRGSIMRFHIYSEFETQAELVMSIASCRLLEGSWEAPMKMGEVQFNKAFDINVIEVDPATGLPALSDGNEVKTPIVMADDVILPASVSKTADSKILENYTDVSFGEITLQEGYNIIEVAVKDCEEYTDGDNKVRTGNISGFRVQALNSDEHEHEVLKQNGRDATCTDYGNEEYYICTICGRMFSDAAAQHRIFNPILKNIDPTAHVWDREHADCMHDRICTRCGEAGEKKTAHDFGGKDLCTSDGELECTMCGNTFRGGHLPVWDNGTMKCLQCGKEFAYKIQAEDTNTVQYKKSDGSDMYPATETATKVGGATVDRGVEGKSIGGVEGKEWQGATMTIPVTADEAGTYLFIIRAQANGSDGGKTPQTLSESLSYCVNPKDGSPEYTPAGGKAIASSPTGGWENMYRWGLTVIAEIELNDGANSVVLKFNDDGLRGPNIDYFMFEKKELSNHSEAEIITTRTDGNEFEQGSGAVGILPGVFMRIKVPDEKVEEFGAAYYDAEITEEMCNAAGFDTSVVGEYSIELTVNLFDKEYKATFTFKVR